MVDLVVLVGGIMENLQLKAVAKEFHDACCDRDFVLSDKIALTILKDFSSEEMDFVIKYYNEYRDAYQV
jgi:hypothetical protein